MGKKDIRLKVYFSDLERYADLWNGGVFCGKQVVKARELSPVSPVLDKADEEDEGMCRALEEFYNDGIAEGKAIGITEGIMELLGELGDVPEKLCRKISGQKDPELLGKWLKIAARAESIGDFEQRIREV